MTRRLVAENAVTVNDLIWPMFVTDGQNVRDAVSSMPGVERVSIDQAVRDAERAAKLKIPAIALFPNTDAGLKDEDGSEALNSANLICRTLRAIKQAVPDIGLITDVALDPYTSHGHDGLIRDGVILNDENRGGAGASGAGAGRAGSDVIAPSDMMDGRIGAIRSALDEAALSRCRLSPYAAKYASAFYGPFRDAVGSNAALKGDKKTYQMDPANGNEAIREVALDLEEGPTW